VLSVPDRPAWMALGKCLGLDPALFYPGPHDDATEAKSVCRTCDVQTACLEFALLRREKHGVWGGESEAGRRRILRRRAQVQNDTIAL
jgi:WhiB family redox-sensing transcriptional regulator